MHTSTVTKKGQIVIPAELRHKLGLREGTKVVITEAADGLRVQPVDESYFEQYAGILPGKGKGVDALLQARKQVRTREKRRSR